MLTSSVEHDDGASQTVDPVSFSKLLFGFKETLKCVVLNACDSEVYADHLVKHIDFVITMGASVDDSAATEFAAALYGALASGMALTNAFDIATGAAGLQKKRDLDTPRLHERVAGSAASFRLPSTRAPTKSKHHGKGARR